MGWYWEMGGALFLCILSLPGEDSRRTEFNRSFSYEKVKGEENPSVDETFSSSSMLWL